MTIKAIIADDHELVREALQVRLQRMDVKIVAEAVNGRQAIDLATSIDFDLILMDISMPIINGVEATQQIKQANPSCKILVLSTHDSQDYIRAVAAAGAVAGPAGAGDRRWRSRAARPTSREAAHRSASAGARRTPRPLRASCAPALRPSWECPAARRSLRCCSSGRPSS